MKSHALVFTGVDQLGIAETSVPEPEAGEVLVEALYTTISPGTELRCLAGRQAGVTFPFIPGYVMIGRVIQTGPQVTTKVGALVACRGSVRADKPLAWGGHMAHAVVGESAIEPIPEGVDLHDAALAKLASIAYRGVRLAGTRPHETVAVVGLGPIGQLAARLHHLTGARIVAADLRADRVDIARSVGIEALQVAGSLGETFKKAVPGGADVVVDASGVASLLTQSIQLARMKPWTNELTEPARLVIQGSYPAEVVFNYEDAFARELTIHVPRDSQPRDLQAILWLLATGRVVFKDLLTVVKPASEAPFVYAALRAAEPGLMTAAFQWNQA